MPLFVDTGSATRAPRDEKGAGPCLAVQTGDDTTTHLGPLLAIASGVAERPDGARAACDAVQAFHDRCDATPEGWDLKEIIVDGFGAANNAVRGAGEAGRACALSGFVLRHRQWALGHVGDTRVWRLRDHQLRLLTQDHVEPRVGRRARVSQACGLDEKLTIDMVTGELATGDIYVLTAEGVHGVLDSALIMGCLVADITATQMAECLVERAAAHGGRHNVSACVARIEALPAERDSDIVKSITTLPVITPPEPGTTLDGFQIESLVHKSRLYRLYKAVDTETGGKVVLKFPNPRYARDETFADNFLREEWIGKRVHSPHLVKALPLRTGRRSALYLVLGYHPGESLAERIKRKRALSVTESLYLMRQLLAALKDLHRQGVVHRDVRPKNILVDKKHKHLLLLGLGESQIDRLAQHTGAIEPSANVTSYMAPELFNAEGGATPQSDLFSAGVTLFRMLTGHYPYGRIQPTDSAPHGEMIGPRHYRKSLPPWLDALLHQACATNPARRFQTAEEFLAALNDGELPHAPSKTAASTPASATSRLWQIRHWELILVGALVVALMLYLAITFR